MKTEDILARQAEVRAVQEAMGTYLVAFEFEARTGAKAMAAPQVGGLEDIEDAEGALTKTCRTGPCRA